MAIVRNLEGLGDMKLHGAALAAATNDAIRRVRGAWTIDALITSVVGIKVMVRQTFGQVVPGRAVGDENVAVGLLAIIMATAGRNPDVLFIVGVRNDGTAVIAG